MRTGFKEAGKERAVFGPRTSIGTKDASAPTIVCYWTAHVAVFDWLMTWVLLNELPNVSSPLPFDLLK